MLNRRQQANANRIRGPQSALTDFLAANNISAAQIRDDYQRRLQAAQQHQQQGESSTANATGDNQEEEAEAVRHAAEAAAASRKRKRNMEAAIDKAKKNKAAARGKGKGKKKKGGSDDEDDADLLGESSYKKAPKLPGQLENCELCGKRFTVTPYNREGANGGMLCAPCGKQITADEKAAKKAEAKKAPVKRRRKLESDRLDGIVTQGAKTLQQLCIEKIAQHAGDVEELGDLPEALMDRLSEIFSKKRVLSPKTLGLFLRPDLDTVAIHDAAYLETENYDQIFAVVPRVKKLVLRNACQFKDQSVEYMLEKAKELESIQLYGANLVTNEMWINLFTTIGERLKVVKLQWLDAAFDDDAVEALANYCPNLERVKLKLCRRIGVDSVNHIRVLKKLQHLSLQQSSVADILAEPIVSFIEAVGINLHTLSLENFYEADDSVLAAVKHHCTRLRKLRLSHNDLATDAGYVDLFTDWKNPPLRHIDFSSTRDIDNNNPDGPLNFPVGLGAPGLKALLAHSGTKLERLDVASCRHITHAGFLEVFDPEKFVYPELQELNLSFCPGVDTSVVAGVFKTCPKLKKLVAFGDFGIEEVTVPKGIVLIGVPKAWDAIEKFGGAEGGYGGDLGAFMDVISGMGGMEAMQEVGRAVGVGA